MTDYRFKDLPDGLTLNSRIRIGDVETVVSTFVQLGMVRQDGSKFIRVSNWHQNHEQSLSKQDPFSPRRLESRGFKVLYASDGEESLVMIQAGAYCRISDALKNGLLNETTKPFNQL